MIKVFTTFSGIGSQEMALRNLGVDYEVVGTSEVDKHAILAYDAIHNNFSYKYFYDTKTEDEILEEIYSKNIAYDFSTGKSQIPKNKKDLMDLYKAHKRNRNFGDIRKIEASSLPDFDLFTYSFPCKNISIAGEQAGLDKDSDTQSSLLWECRKMIVHKQPKFLLMENVKNLVGKRHIGDFETWISELDSMGYNSYWKVLNGKDFGVPQNRERVMMVSVLKEYDGGYSFQEYEGESKQLCDIMDDDVEERALISPDRYCDLDMDKIDAEYTEVAHNLIQVGNLAGKLHATRRIYSDKGISPTLTSMNGGDREPKIYTNRKVRKLTALECWRIMGFSDEDYEKARDKGGLPMSKLYERAGRGIVVPMLESIFENMFDGEYDG